MNPSSTPSQAKLTGLQLTIMSIASDKEAVRIRQTDRHTRWPLALSQLQTHVDNNPTRDAMANMANAVSILRNTVFSGEDGIDTTINWIGVYVARPVRLAEAAKATCDRVLVVGPHVGQPAVTTIAPHRGVCGTCLVSRRSRTVANVHAEPNHIACDPKSKSEMVVPMVDARGRVLALFDLDASVVDTFAPSDVQGLEQCAALLAKASHWTSLEHPVVLSTTAYQALCKPIEACLMQPKKVKTKKERGVKRVRDES